MRALHFREICQRSKSSRSNRVYRIRSGRPPTFDFSPVFVRPECGKICSTKGNACYAAYRKIQGMSIQQLTVGVAWLSE